MKQVQLLCVVCMLFFATSVRAEQFSIAAAADLKFAMDEIVAGFKKENPGTILTVTYGSSGKFHTQIQQGAPFDLFFSADISFPRELARAGLASSEVKPYAVGRIVLWSARMDAAKITLTSLTDPKTTRIAIANPKHAPYGKRAEEALKSSGLWERLQSKFVYGENIAQAAQYVQSGNAQVGIIALSLALSPELARSGGYYLIPDKLHNPLEQGFIITKTGAGKQTVRRFADFMGSKKVREIMTRYGFVLPGEAADK